MGHRDINWADSNMNYTLPAKEFSVFSQIAEQYDGWMSSSGCCSGSCGSGDGAKAMSDRSISYKKV